MAYDRNAHGDDDIEEALAQEYREAEARVDEVRRKVHDHHLSKIQRLIEAGELRIAQAHLRRIPDILTQCSALAALQKAGWKDSHRF